MREVLPQEEAQKGILANGYTYHYDSAGRRTAAVGPDGNLLERRVYDSAGNLAELYDGVELGGEPQTDTNAVYRTQTEQAGEPQTDTVHPADKETQTACTRYAYDLAGRRTLVETPGTAGEISPAFSRMHGDASQRSRVQTGAWNSMPMTTPET